MTRVLLLLVALTGCRAADSGAPAAAADLAPLQVSQGPPPSYFQTDNVDSSTSLRTRR